MSSGSQTYNPPKVNIFRIIGNKYGHYISFDYIYSKGSYYFILLRIENTINLRERSIVRGIKSFF
jgi:hypothetical protein